LLLLVAILPLVYISRYSHPCADDYTYGRLTHAAWQETHSLFPTIKQAFEQVKISYNTWQGTYSSIFLMSLSPAVFEDSISYGMTSVLMLAMLLASVFCITYSVFVKIVKTQRWKWFFIAALTSFWMIESMHSPVNGIYWFNGSVHYFFMHAIMLFMITCSLNYCIEKREKNRLAAKIIYIALTAIFTVFCGGANYSTALLGICVLALMLLGDCILSKKFSLLAIPLVTYIAAFLTSIVAPGNSVRSSKFDGKGPIFAILESMKLAIKDDLTWTDLQFVIIILLALPVLYNITKYVKITIKWWIPIASVILSYLFHSVLNVPLFFAMGGGALARQENICKFWFQLMVMFNVFLIICAVKPLTDKILSKIAAKLIKPKSSTSGFNPLPILIIFYVLMFGIMLVHVKKSPKCIYQYSSYVAYSQYRSGEILEYEAIYQERMSIIESDAADIILPAYTSKPYLLYFDDITSDPYDWRNTAFAQWYGKNSVITQ